MRKPHLILLVLLVWLGSCQRSSEARRDAFYQKGQSFLKAAKYEDAIIEFRNALQIDDRHVPSNVAIGEAFEKVGNHSQALASYQKVLQLDSENAEAKLKVGVYHLLSGSQDAQHFTEARRLAEELLAKDPKNLRARVLLGNAYAGLQDFGRAIEQMKQVLSEDPGNLAASLNLGAYQQQIRDAAGAEKTFLDTIARHPKSPEARRALGAFFAASQRFVEAEAQYRRAYDLQPRDAANLYELVRFFLGTKQPDRATSVFEEAIKKTPDWPEPLWGLANLHLSEGRYREGLVVLNVLKERDPKNRQLRLRLCEVYLGLKDTRNAAQAIDQILKEDPNDAEGHFLRGRLLAYGGKEGDALKEYSKATELNRNLLPAYREKTSLLMKRMEFADALLALNEILRISPTDIASQGVRAKVFAITGRTREALEEALVVLSQSPGNIDARVARAEALLNSGKIQEAREDFGTLLKTDPENAFFLHRLGRIELLNKNRAAATAFFSKALQGNPNLVDVIRDYLGAYASAGDFRTAHSVADQFLKTADRKDILHLFKGELYFQEKKFAEAEAEFRKAVALEPRNFGAYLSLGQTKQAQNQLPEAIREVDNLIKREPRFAPAYMLKAFYMESGGDTKGAIAHYQKALELSPDNPVAANNIAWLYCQMNQNLEQALSLARKAREKAPNDGHIADTLGWIYYKMGNYTLAADQLTFAINQGAQGPENYYRHGMACYRQGDKLKAKQSLRKAIELNARFAGSEEAKKVLQELG